MTTWIVWSDNLSLTIRTLALNVIGSVLLLLVRFTFTILVKVNVCSYFLCSFRGFLCVFKKCISEISQVILIFYLCHNFDLYIFSGMAVSFNVFKRRRTMFFYKSLVIYQFSLHFPTYLFLAYDNDTKHIMTLQI